MILVFPLAGWANPPPEAALFDAINGARKDAQLNALELDDALCDVARSHAEEMIALKYFSHRSPVTGTPISRLRKAGVTFKCGGENLAGDTDVTHAFGLWMDSRAHKGNITGDFTKVGISVVRGGLYGLMIVAVFTK